MLQVYSASTFTASGVGFHQNSATGGNAVWGGALTSLGGRIHLTDGTSFTMNTAFGGELCMGGAIFVSYGQLDATSGTTFIGNVATGLDFSSLEVCGPNIPSIRALPTMAMGRKVSGSYAAGGGIFVISSRATLCGTRFAENAAKNALKTATGGALSMDNSDSLVDISDAWFENNEAANAVHYTSYFSTGGAISTSGGVLKVKTTSFVANRVMSAGLVATSGGGAIEVDNAYMSLGEGVRFVGNIAANSENQPEGLQRALGGAIYFHGQEELSGETSRSNLEFCSGGGCETVESHVRSQNTAEGTPGVVLMVHAPTFIGNSAQYHGGQGGSIAAIFAGFLQIVGATFDSNFVTVQAKRGTGGALFGDSSLVFISNSTFHENWVSMTSARTILVTGGAIDFTSGKVCRCAGYARKG